MHNRLLRQLICNRWFELRTNNASRSKVSVQLNPTNVVVSVVPALELAVRFVPAMHLDGFSFDIRTQKAAVIMRQGWGAVRSLATSKAQDIALHFMQGTPLGMWLCGPVCSASACLTTHHSKSSVQSVHGHGLAWDYASAEE
jgi:hypothetical protein